MLSYLPKFLVPVLLFGFTVLSSVACRTLEDRSALKQEIQAPTPAVWTSEDGNVLLNGKVFHLKGANWFGLETPGIQLLGLSKRSMSSMLDWLVSEQFNSLRIPISVEMSLNFDYVPQFQELTAEDADLQGKPWVAALDKLIAESSKRGIVIMLDMHTVSAGDNLTTKVWYNNRYSVCDFREAWQRVLDRYGHHWNIFALDLKNELHDVDWGTGSDPKITCRTAQGFQSAPAGASPKDWKQEVELLVPELAISRKTEEGKSFTYQGLYLVQGMHHGRVGPSHSAFPYDLKKGFGYWYGGNLEGVRKGKYPLVIPASLENRIAYTIHVYGPSVYPQPYFDELDAYRNPDRLDVVFESQNGFIEEDTGRAVIIGEWGGINDVLDGKKDPLKKGKDDRAIIGAIAKWFPENCMADAFWWAINPESEDTGGLLTDDYQSPLKSKLDQARKMMAKPTQVRLDANGQIQFVERGAFHPACASGKRAPTPECKAKNNDGLTCRDLGMQEGAKLCDSGNQWECKQGCAEWRGFCQAAP